ncbi:MAG: fibronectin type III domain-containing protein [Bacteroidia bacterium]|nr:fibronectin type III domain-containing protein [Bacteroidia bacterium]MDW8159067.1 fibronectin type III domain-containing protein [Bacteroidia bacterium]
MLTSFWAVARENPQAQRWLERRGVYFTENKGQIFDTEGKPRPDILFTTDINGTRLYFRNNAISYVFPQIASVKGQEVLTQLYRMDLELLNANPHAEVISEDMTNEISNFYLAHLPNGIEGVKSYRKITYKNIYNKIDLVFYGANGSGAIKYDFIIHPGGKVSDIKLKYNAATTLKKAKDGSLQIGNPLGTISENTPYSYTLDKDHNVNSIHSEYVINGDVVTFKVDNYDNNQTLIIDPLARTWATYYGANSLDRAYGVAIGPNGNIAVVGYTQNTGFPVSPGAFQGTFSGVNDAFAILFDPSGNRIWSTFYGGTSIDQANSVVIDANNNVYFTGYSSSTDFSVTQGSGQAGGGDVFVVRLSSTGARNWALLLGGNSNDQGNSIALDRGGNVLVAGTTFSPNFPVNNAFQQTFGGIRDAFVVKMAATNGTTLWSTYLGGANDDQAFGVDADANNNVVVAGLTSSNNFPATSGTYTGGNDVFVASLNANGQRNWAIYWGGTQNEQANAVAVDAANNIIITGQTNSTSGIATPGAIQSTFGGGARDIFVAKLNNSGTPQWATYYGGSADDEGLSIAADAGNNIYITGITNSANFRTQAALQSTSAGNNEAFILELGSTGSLRLASYYGGSQNEVGRGIAVRGNTVVVVGQTSSINFPVQNPYQQFRGGNDDAFILALQSDATPACNIVVDGIPTNERCDAPRTGAINITVSGGTPPYRYQWSGPGGFTSTQANISGLGAGVYSLTVTDNANPPCQATVNFSVLPATNLVITPTVLNEQRAINITVTGGSGNYTYAWRGPGGFSATTQNVSNLTTPGTYTVTVTEVGTGCSASAFPVFTGALTGCPIFRAVKTDIACFGLTDGKMEVVTEAVPVGDVVEYSIDNGRTWVSNNIFLGLAKGNYTIRARVRNKPQCDFAQNFTIVEPELMQVTGSFATNVSCTGGSDGSIQLQVRGGTPDQNGNYRYFLVSGSQETPTTNPVRNLRPGTYVVRVVDVNNCSAETRSVVISEPAAPLSANILSQSNVSCFGASNGSFNVLAAGGTPPYVYILRPQGGTPFPPQASGSFNNLPAGNHTVTIRDANNCTLDIPARITQPAELRVNVLFTRDATCFNSADGSITVGATGGVAPYRYSINGGEFRPAVTFSGLARGEYIIRVRDANGCEASTGAVSIFASPQITITNSSVTTVDCFGNRTGGVSITVAGGIPPYTYRWSNGATTPNVTGLPAGNVSVTITDALGCSLTQSFDVPTNTNLVVRETINQPSCNGGSDGSIVINVTGGEPPYSYTWSTGANTKDLLGIRAGRYTVTVIDRLGCALNESYNVAEPTRIDLGIPMVTNVSCNGGNDGRIALMVSGGTPPYGYAWSNGGTNSFIENLTAGNYTVNVNDANGCTVPARTITVSQPDPLVASLAPGGDLSCFESFDGRITVLNTAGGTPPYSYSISLNGQVVGTNSTGIFSGLAAGTYVVTVRDVNNCSFTTTKILTQPNQIIGTVTFKANIACFGLTDGKIYVSASGGTGSPLGFLYSLNNPLGPFTTTNTFDGLSKGVQTVYIRDLGNNCVAAIREEIFEPTKLRIVSAEVSNISCEGFPTATITVRAEGGTTLNASNEFVPYQYKINDRPFGLSNVFTNLAPGNYTVVVRDHNLCTDTVRVRVDAGLNARLTVTPTSCFGGRDGSIVVEAFGGRPPYTYSLDGSPFTANNRFTSLAAGTYQVRAMDSRGCMFVQNQIVGSRPSIQPTIIASHPERCEGQLITLTATTNLVPGSPLRYQWLDSNRNPIPGATSSNYVTGVSGIFFVSITDVSSGCTETSPGVVARINPDPRPVISTLIPNAPIRFCKGNKVELIANTAQVPDPIYNWFRDGIFVQGGIDRIYTAFETGVYTVRVITGHGCVNESPAFQVIVDPNPEANIYQPSKNIICPGETIRLQSSRDINWSYQWSRNGAPISNTNDFVFNATQPGSYTVTITNRLTGCRATSPAVVLNENPLSFTTRVVEPTGCGQNTGLIEVTASGNVGQTFYSVNGSQQVPFNGSFSIGNLVSGPYRIDVSDAQCTVSRTITLQVAAPRIVSRLDIASNRIDISWTPIPGARYDIEYRVVGAETWTTIRNLANNIAAFSGAPIPSVRITGLQHQTRYEFRVRAVCSSGATSEWSPIERATTPTQTTGTCFMPANIYVNRVPNDPEAVLVYWTVPFGGELRPVCYDLEYRVKGTDNWFALRIGSNEIPYRLRPLLTSTTYELRMRTNCVSCPGFDETRRSTYSPVIEFETTNLCPEANSLTLNGGSATETVCGGLELKVDNLADNENIRYKWLYSSDGLEYQEAAGNNTARTYKASITGFYVAVVTIGNCEPVTTAPINVRVNAIPGVIAEVVSNVSCYKGTNGSLRAGCTGEACVDAQGRADYQFSLDRVNWQDNGLFENLAAGLYTVYVRKVSTGCQSSFSHPVYTNITQPGLPEFEVEWPGGSNIDVRWAQVSGASGYRIAYRILGSGDNDWNYISVDQPFIPSPEPIIINRRITNLQRNGTIYEVRLQTRCAATNALGEWTTSKTVIVDAQDPFLGCVTPGGVFINNISQTSARINWQPTAQAISYIVEYREIGESQFTRINNVQGTSYTLTGLVSGGQYFARVIARCSNLASDISLPSVTLLFATSLAKEATAANSLVTDLLVYPNPNNGIFNISLNAVESSNATVTLTDLSGRVILEKVFEVHAGNNQLPLELQGYTPGVYLLQFKQGSERHVVKVILN